MTTIFSPLRLRSAKSRTVIGRFSRALLVNARAPQGRQLGEPKIPPRQFRMRDGESFFVNALVLEQHDVEVQRAWSATSAPHTPRLRFYPVQLREQVAWRQLGLDGNHLIEKWSLRDGADRRGLLDPGLSEHARARQRGQCGPRLRQKYLTLAEVGAERYVGDILHARSRSSATSA